MSPKADSIVVEAELRTAMATSQLVNFDLAGSDYSFLDPDRHWIDLCLTPRPVNTRACFSDRWGPHRFEKVGTVFLVPCGEPAQFHTDGGRQSSIICQFHRERISETLQQAMHWTEDRVESVLDIPSRNIGVLMHRLADELRAPGFAQALMADLIVAEIIVELCRFGTEIQHSPNIGGLAAWRMRTIDERLEEIREPPTLAELATLCNLSVRQLTRSFRATKGCSLGDYITQRRIETAKRLLTAEDSIKTVAYAMGFTSPSHFSHAFGREVGLTPRQFRAEHARRH